MTKYKKNLILVIILVLVMVSQQVQAEENFRM